MTSRSDVSELVTVSARATTLASVELDSVFRTIGTGDPKRARDALLKLYPAIGKKYGSVVSTAYGQWFEAQRMAQTGAPGKASLTGLPSIDEMAGTVKYAAKFLFEGNPTSALSLLQGALQRHVTDSGRNTIYDSAAKDALRPRFGRIPSGGETCSFCFMLASRGFIYASQDSAGDSRKYHDHCNCQIVPEWKPGGARVEGYDPDAMYALYRDARRSAKSKNPKDILAEMRAKYPDMLTDGLGKPKSLPAQTPTVITPKPDKSWMSKAESTDTFDRSDAVRVQLEDRKFGEDAATYGWTDKSSDVWQRYTEVGYMDMNSLMRDPKAVTHDATKLLQLQDDIDTLSELINKNTIPEDIIVHRGVIPGPKLDPATLKPGQSFSDPAFLSTSTSDLTAADFASGLGLEDVGIAMNTVDIDGWVFVTKAPAGVNAVPGSDNEFEMIFKPGQMQRVIEVDLENRKVYTEMVL